MNLLAQLICSRARAEIFRVLCGIKADELHLRAIHRQTGFAVGTVRQHIGKLVKLGLLTSRQDGHRVYYAANGRRPPAHDVPMLMAKLVDWLSRELEAHPVLLSGFAQFQLVHIHPFLDGNGRASRQVAARQRRKGLKPLGSGLGVAPAVDEHRP